MLPTPLSTSFDPKLFASTFGLIFVAELPDKTAFATLLLATRNRPLAIFVGVAAAFVVQSFFAVTFGSVLGMMPEHFVKIGAAGLFFAFAVSMWLRKELEEEEAEIAKKQVTSFWKTVSTSFIVIFIAEWGDLTQLATATLEAKYENPLTVFASATLALWAVTALAILVGNRIQRVIEPSILQKIAAVAFGIVGAILLLGVFRS